jgi:hypothetical protein
LPPISVQHSQRPPARSAHRARSCLHSGTGSRSLSADRSPVQVDAIRPAPGVTECDRFQRASRRSSSPAAGTRSKNRSTTRPGETEFPQVGWLDSNSRPADYEKYGSVHPCPLTAPMTRDIALAALAALGVSSDRAMNRSTPAAPIAPRPVTVRNPAWERGPWQLSPLPSEGPSRVRRIHRCSRFGGRRQRPCRVIRI